MPIIDSIALVERSVRARVGGTPRRSTINVSARPSRRLPAAPGWVLSSSAANTSNCAWASNADGAWLGVEVVAQDQLPAEHAPGPFGRNQLGVAGAGRTFGLDRDHVALDVEVDRVHVDAG